MHDFLKSVVARLLRLEAMFVVRRYKPKIIAVTGSVGKTSTKDAIYSVVAHDAYARKSEKSFNSEIGLPLTILGRPNAWRNPIAWVENLLAGAVLLVIKRRYPEWLVLEAGADRPGDIRSLSSWLPIDVAVITRLPDVPVHVKFFDSPEAVKEEKASLIEALVPGGALVLYADDAEVERLRHRAPGARVVTFGFSEVADVRGSNMHIVFEEIAGAQKPVGMSAEITIDGATEKLAIDGALGTHALLPALAAAAVGKALAKPLPDIIDALRGYEPPKGRMHLVEGEKHTVIIDDTYNSSPAAAQAALETLAMLPKGRKIAILGDMLELGRHSVDEHRKLGALAAKSATILMTVGFRARDIAEGALDNGMKEDKIFQYEESEQAAKELEEMLKEGDIVLVKGSQSMRTERIVEEIMADPSHAADMLVRQDEEWKKR
ncbi:MAG TPA: UDP-N-acetylmuramoyl-tripeptide--D-alanyl-D-alanine ligase [Candidatus Paceibacterota bacterium]|nr:UDP-N-acetylmuramoyl-tripeptide--D-alanyl-D-alanine ligase [Candidatus Paceibacterota bacterium]